MVLNNIFIIILNNLLNEILDKFFSCEWKDFDFFIIYGLGIVCLFCILIGGFYIIVGEDKNFFCILFICECVRLLILLKIYCL